MAALDKSRDYGEIFGDSEGRRYLQDGVYFDAMGKPVGKSPDVPKASKKVQPAVAEAPKVSDQLDAQLTQEFQ